MPFCISPERRHLYNEIFRTEDLADKTGMNTESMGRITKSELRKTTEQIGGLKSVSPKSPGPSISKYSMEESQVPIPSNPLQQKRKHEERPGKESSDNERDDDDNQHETTIETSLVVPREEVEKYWNGPARNFVRHLVGEDWPSAYGSPCAVVFSYCQTKKFKSAKRLNHFCRMVGSCKICNAKHICMIQKSRFDETMDEKGVLHYKTRKRLL